jgi:hypothetical protein
MSKWLPLLDIIAGAIALGTLLLSLRQPRSEQDPTSAERRELKYGDGPKALIIVLGTLVPATVLYLYSTGRIDMNVALLCLALDVFVVGYAGPEFFRTRIEFDSDHVYTYSAWRKPRVIPWSVIMACKYSPLKHWHVFDTFGYGSLRVSDFMEGTSEFVAQFKKRGQECIDFSQARSAA